MLLQTMHDIIGDAIAFFFSQFLAKPAHKFARTSQRESDGKTSLPLQRRRAAALIVILGKQV